jgi:hypothetical protein
VYFTKEMQISCASALGRSAGPCKKLAIAQHGEDPIGSSIDGLPLNRFLSRGLDRFLGNMPARCGGLIFTEYYFTNVTTIADI